MTARVSEDRRPVRHRQSPPGVMLVPGLLIVIALLVVVVTAVLTRGSSSVPLTAEGIEAPDPAAGVPASPEFAPVTPVQPSAPPTPDPTETSASPTPAEPSPLTSRSAADPTSAPPPTPEALSRGIPPVQVPQDRGMLHVRPVRVEIPTVGIASDLVDLHLNPGGSLQVPEDYDRAGWYADGPYPGDVTSPPAIIVGHVDSTTGPAVFYRIRELVEGDEILVTRRDGSVAVFVVRDAVQYPKSDLPTHEVYRDRRPSELVLITCTGDFDRDANSYLDNFVVTARLDREASGLGT